MSIRDNDRTPSSDVGIDLLLAAFFIVPTLLACIGALIRRFVL